MRLLARVCILQTVTLCQVTLGQTMALLCERLYYQFMELVTQLRAGVLPPSYGLRQLLHF